MAKAKVTGGSLHFRSAASIGAGVIEILSNGTAVNVLETEGDWSKVCVKDREGYVMTRYLSFDQAAKTTGGAKKKTASRKTGK